MDSPPPYTSPHILDADEDDLEMSDPRARKRSNNSPPSNAGMPSTDITVTSLRISADAAAAATAAAEAEARAAKEEAKKCKALLKNHQIWLAFSAFYLLLLMLDVLEETDRISFLWVGFQMTTLICVLRHEPIFTNLGELIMHPSRVCRRAFQNTL